MISRDNISEKIINLENNQRQKKDIKFLKPEKPNIYEIKYNKYSGSKENLLSAVIYIYTYLSRFFFMSTAFLLVQLSATGILSMHLADTLMTGNVLKINKENICKSD